MAPQTQLVLALVSAGLLPTLSVLVSLLINNSRLADLQRYMDHRFGAVDQRFVDTQRSMDQRFVDMQRHMDRRFDEQATLLRGEMYRMEQVLDARLKHLEEHR